ncbi:hypothetical protein N9H19_02435 [Flavobacteriales bacterium]|nr:hypothetical protein [Flavobacteriales bacterium]
MNNLPNLKSNLVDKFLSLQSLVKSLNKSEANILKKYLLAFEEPSSRINKSIDLLSCLREKSNLSIELVKLKLEIDSDDAFRKLMSRLFDKYIQSLCLDVSINKGKKYNKVLIAEKEIYKLLFSIDFCFLSESSEKEVLQHLKRAIKKAYKFESFHFVLDGLYKKQKIINNNLPQIYHEIFYVESLNNLLNECRRVVCQVQFNLSFNKTNNIAELKKLRLKIEPFLNYNKFRLYDFQLNALLIECSKSFKKLIKYNVGFIDFVSNSHIIYCPHLLASIYVKQSDCCLSLKDFENSYCSLIKAKEVYSKHNISNSKLLFKEGLLLFYMGKLNECNSLIQKLIASDCLSLVDNEKLLYLSSCISFKQKKFDLSNFYRSQIHKLKKTYSSWNFSIRVLTILACMENEQTKDIAMDHLESLRRYSSRSLKDDNIKLKCKLIVRIIYAIQREGYDFNCVLEKENSYIEQLLDLESSFSDNFDLSGYVMFTDWFFEKIKKC